MHRLVISFFITLVLYILLFLAISLDLHPKQEYRKLPERHPLSLGSVRLLKPQPPAMKKSLIKEKKATKKQQIAQPQKVVKIAKRGVNKRAKKRVRILKKRSIKKKRVAKKRASKSSHEALPSLSQIFAKKSHPQKKIAIPKNISRLYKDKFETFTKTQREFIKDNLDKIGLITQKYLYLRGYPYIAAKTKQEGTNIVEFYLHPNGDITDLHIIQSSGFEVLDENSLETIKTAYKDYPLPSQTTLIRIKVRYSIIY
ncbi:energy transducer TonB [Nitratiruptor sp. YY09-18]|uniref:energy transducer TonB n=1 Tax=Nitratiruptor sp. YY09-18 TaxID=2724901 RepID=UPI00191668EA|nr:energy transducer TonB [Nitratiruptor sp. YY09-18]BCD67920.1 periplasmic protein TonB [Nitratiruptor sp. YY09-18]